MMAAALRFTEDLAARSLGIPARRAVAGPSGVRTGEWPRGTPSPAGGRAFEDLLADAGLLRLARRKGTYVGSST
jgi:hypothetical protein